jgi:glutamyl-tRNA synthetase
MPVTRGRFAPSPTGPIHLGTARTALVAWLHARSTQGAFVLRVEDLDAPRVKAGALEAMLEDLRWLGLDWDEGPDIGGDSGPYLQSARLPLYEKAIRDLTAGGFLYPCTCSRKEIAGIASAPHGEDGPVYPGLCRKGPTHPERAASLRFRYEQSEGFVDGVHGSVAAGQGLGDFVVQRADGVFAYQLAVVVDDLAMGITHVVRGDDLLLSTPRQIALTRALGAAPLAYAHVPLVLGEDGQRLAKRHGSIAIQTLRGTHSSEQIVGLLAHSLGLQESDAPCTATSLVPRFSLQRLSRAPFVWR